MVASGLTAVNPAIQASIAACWELAPAPEIVPDTEAAASPPEPGAGAAAVPLAAPQPARSRAPLVASPIAAIRAREACRTVFTRGPPSVRLYGRLAVRRRTVGNRGGRVPPRR